MKKSPRFLAAILGLIAVILGAQESRSLAQAGKPPEVGERVTLEKHGCSVPMPKGWISKEAKHGGTMFLSPKESGFDANINVTGEVSTVTLRVYADAVLKGVQTAMKEAKIVSDAPFATDAGPAIKVTMNNKISGKEIVQTLYFFEGAGGRKIVFIASAVTTQNAALAPAFDACMKGLKPLTP